MNKMNKLFSINKSRLGFNYQYKFALLEILKYALRGRLREAYVDYGFAYKRERSLSVDILLKFEDKIHIYEVKTGEEFKKDPIEELRQVFKTLFLYEKYERAMGLRGACARFLIISPEAESKIHDHWSDFEFLKSNRRKKNSGENKDQVYHRVIEQFNLLKLSKAERAIRKFIRSIKFEVGPNYKKEDGDDNSSELEELIDAKINRLCIKMRAIGSSVEIPNHIIALELLGAINDSVEYNKDCYSKLWLVLLDALSRRKLLTKATYSDGNKECILEEILQETKANLVSITKFNAEENKAGVTSVPEGETI